FSSSSWPPALPSSPLILFRSRRDGGPTLHSVIVTHGERDVDRAQHGENEGLHHADERSEAVERDRDANLREAGEDLHHLVVRHHVGEQPDAERDGPEDVAEQLDDQHEGVEENHRAEELLHVPEAVLARATRSPATSPAVAIFSGSPSAPNQVNGSSSINFPAPASPPTRPLRGSR